MSKKRELNLGFENLPELPKDRPRRRARRSRRRGRRVAVAVALLILGIIAYSLSSDRLRGNTSDSSTADSKLPASKLRSWSQVELGGSERTPRPSAERM